MVSLMPLSMWSVWLIVPTSAELKRWAPHHYWSVHTCITLHMYTMLLCVHVHAPVYFYVYMYRYMYVHVHVYVYIQYVRVHVRNCIVHVCVDNFSALHHVTPTLDGV